MGVITTVYQTPEWLRCGPISYFLTFL